MKRIALLVSIFFACKSLTAQISVGFLTGNNFGTIKDNTNYKDYPDLIEPEEEDYSFTNGFFVGIPVEVGLTNKLSLHTTFSYIQKGTELNSTISLGDYTFTGSGKMNYNYLELPFQAKFLIVNERTKVYLLAGPSVGYLISDKKEFNSTIYNSKLGTVTNEDVNDKRNSKELKDSGLNLLDVSLTVGIGCNYKVGIGNINFNFNYIHGLTNLLKQGDGFSVGPRQYNRGFNTNIGYLIPLTK